MLSVSAAVSASLSASAATRNTIAVNTASRSSRSASLAGSSALSASTPSSQPATRPRSTAYASRSANGASTRESGSALSMMVLGVSVGALARMSLMTTTIFPASSDWRPIGATSADSCAPLESDSSSSLLSDCIHMAAITVARIAVQIRTSRVEVLCDMVRLLLDGIRSQSCRRTRSHTPLRPRHPTAERADCPTLRVDWPLARPADARRS